MKSKLMTAASLLALMIAHPAVAQGVLATTNQNTTMSEDIQQGLRNTDAAMHDTAQDIRGFFIGVDDDNNLTPVFIRGNLTATGLIGKTIINSEDKKIATVKDIIIGKNGKAALVVVSDDGLLGIGSKVAAFDYTSVVTQKYDGTVVMALSEEMIQRAADFSYDPKDWPKAKVIPAGSVSTNMLLEGDVLNSKGEKVASIDNVYFRYADVTQIIVGFHKTMGKGGDFASLDYDDMRMIKKDGGLDFKLTAKQSAHFKNFKASVAN